jgi:hypothetical protein
VVSPAPNVVPITPNNTEYLVLVTALPSHKSHPVGAVVPANISILPEGAEEIPAGPVGPVEAAGPVAPETPVGPVGPVGPLTPEAPGEPGAHYYRLDPGM